MTTVLDALREALGAVVDTPRPRGGKGKRAGGGKGGDDDGSEADAMDGGDDAFGDADGDDFGAEAEDDPALLALLGGRRRGRR